MKKIKNEKGFSAVEIILVVAVVALLSVVGWLIYDKSKSKNSSNQNPGTTQKTTNPTPNPSVGTAPCPNYVKTKANSYNTDSTDNRVSCALAYGQQQSDAMPIDNGSVFVVSALYATQLGATAYTGGESGIVNVVIHNDTSSSQSYDPSQFTLQLPNGQQVAFSSIYQSQGDSAITVASGGKVTQILIFNGIQSTSATSGTGKLVYDSSQSNAKPSSVDITFNKPYAYTD